MVGILYLLCDPHVSLTAGASRYAYKRGGGGGAAARRRRRRGGGGGSSSSSSSNSTLQHQGAAL
jgi:hypothetical protein